MSSGNCLAGDFDNSGPGRNELVFAQEHKFRPGLRALVADPKVGTAAGQLLAFIGVPDDVRLFIDHAHRRSESYSRTAGHTASSALF